MGWGFLGATPPRKAQPVIVTLKRYFRFVGRDRACPQRSHPGRGSVWSRPRGFPRRLFDESRVIQTNVFRDDDQLGAPRRFVVAWRTVLPHRCTSPLALPGLVLLQDSALQHGNPCVPDLLTAAWARSVK